MAKNNDDPKQKCYEICSTFLQRPWKNISIEDMKFSEFKGGLLNKLFYCALPDYALESINPKEDVPKEVLVRFYGPMQQDEEALTRQLIIFAMLSERNIGPKLYGVFPNGRVEQYLPSKSTSTMYDFLDVYADVAKEIAKYHSQQMPIKKSSSSLEDNIYKWLDNFKKDLKNSPNRSCEFMSSGEFEREFAWAMDEAKKIGAKIVFCHNDLQGGNVLVLKNPPKNLNKRIAFVDYEFSGYNYRAYDMVDYFIFKCVDFNPTDEPSLFEIYYNQFPTKDEQEKFVDAYLDELQKQNKEFLNDIQKEEEKKQILKEIPFITLGSCCFITLVLLKVGLYSKDEFPYWEAGLKIWAMHKKFKEEILQNQKSNEILKDIFER